MGIETAAATVPVWLSYVSAFGTVIATGGLVFSGYAIFQNSQSRELTISRETFRDLQASRDVLSEKGLLDMTESEYGLYRYLQFLEHVCWLMNTRAITGKARKFYRGWLDGEVPSILSAEAVMQFINEDELQETVKYRKDADRRNKADLMKRKRQEAVQKTFRSVEALRALGNKTGPLHEKKTELQARQNQHGQ